MRKNIPIFLALLLCTVLLAGCSCRHEWQEATCTGAKHCAKCDTRTRSNAIILFIKASVAAVAA